MPELPEVETIVRELNESQLIGLYILDVEVFWARSVATHASLEFCQQLHGEQILSITRRAKYIVLTLTHYSLLVHLRMTGKFYLNLPPVEQQVHERLRLLLSDGRSLHYVDQRKFGKWYLMTHPEAQLGKLGIEPFSQDYTFKAFQALLQKSSQALKPFLLNQSYIVGLGNIYVDEALFEAFLHPLRKAKTLKRHEQQALFKAIPWVLKKGIANMGTSLGSKNANYFSVSGRRGGNQHQLQVFRRDGLPCSRCATTLIKIIVAQRGTHLCPVCQQL